MNRTRGLAVGTIAIVCSGGCTDLLGANWDVHRSPDASIVDGSTRDASTTDARATHDALYDGGAGDVKADGGDSYDAGSHLDATQPDGADASGHGLCETGAPDGRIPPDEAGSGGDAAIPSGGDASGALCETSDAGDSCSCSADGPANASTCSPTTLANPGACCADPGWPGSGDCTCQSFLCYPNAGGGRDCAYQYRGGDNFTTSATGYLCCTWGNDEEGFLCSCYSEESGDSCVIGGTNVDKCTSDKLMPCSSSDTIGDNQVTACR